MYLYIFENSYPAAALNLCPAFIGPGKILVIPKAPMKNALITHEASVIFSFHTVGSFTLIKNRYGANVDELAIKYLGIRVFDDGFFVSDKDLLLFTLKYQGLTSEKVVDFPLI